LRNGFDVNGLGWVSSSKRKIEAVVNFHNDDKDYKTYKSATQQTIHSSNGVWFIKILSQYLH